ncbi:MAG: fumarylacetoacetate hydrolase [Streptosporangiales bacterium]|nr:fumarylacetoacetate hydrolase [Streptosporangiales bacterium]
MKVANVAGRLALVVGEGAAERAVDVGRASDGRLPSDPGEAYGHWDELRAWAAEASAAGARRLDELAEPLDPRRLGEPSPSPRQVFAIGLNYRDHAAEAGQDVPTVPQVFTKFPTCLAGPYADVVLPSDRVDWEVELVVVIGRRAEDVAEADAWSYVAGLTLGQDISERRVQFATKPPQFSMGKSYPTFGPIGPVLVTADEFADPDDLELGCRVGDEEVQRARTSLMIFTIPQLLAYLSGICPLLPGDLIFTGTPAGVGSTRNPRRYLQPGEVIESFAENIGTMRNRCVSGP